MILELVRKIKLTSLGMKKSEKRLKSKKKATAKIEATWWFGVIATVIIP